MTILLTLDFASTFFWVMGAIYIPCLKRIHSVCVCMEPCPKWNEWIYHYHQMVNIIPYSIWMAIIIVFFFWLFWKRNFKKKTEHYYSFVDWFGCSRQYRLQQQQQPSTSYIESYLLCLFVCLCVCVWLNQKIPEFFFTSLRIHSYT